MAGLYFSFSILEYSRPDTTTSPKSWIMFPKTQFWQRLPSLGMDQLLPKSGRNQPSPLAASWVWLF